MAVPDFSFSSETDQWFTSQRMIDFANLLTGGITHDLCGLSPYWGEHVKQHGSADGGLETFTRTRGLWGANVFANPPYGKLPSQRLVLPVHYMTDRDFRYLPDSLDYNPTEQTLTAPMPRNRLGKEGNVYGENGFGVGPDKDGQITNIPSNVHSAHTFAHYLLKLWQDGIIKQAFIIIPSATDTVGHDHMFRNVGFVMNTIQRLTFESPQPDGTMKKVSGNTKGSSLFWLPPHSFELYQEPDYVRTKVITRRLTNIRTKMGSAFPKINLSVYRPF